MTEHRRGSGTSLALMGTHVLCSSGGYVVTKIAFREFSPLAFGFWRFIVGIVALLILALAMNAWPKIERQDWKRIIGLAILAVPLNQTFFLVGMEYTVPSHASLLYGTTAAFALLLGGALGYEQVRWYKVAAIVLSVIGLSVVVFGAGHISTHQASFWGDMWVLLGVLVWAAYTVLGKPMVTKYGAIPATIVILVVGSLLGLPILIPSALAQDYSLITASGWLCVLYSGIIVTAASYIIWFTLLKRIDPSQVAILSTPQPIVTALLSAVFLGEILRLPLITGGLLVIGGIVMMEAPALINQSVVTYKRIK